MRGVRSHSDAVMLAKASMRSSDGVMLAQARIHGRARRHASRFERPWMLACASMTTVVELGHP